MSRSNGSTVFLLPSIALFIRDSDGKMLFLHVLALIYIFLILVNMLFNETDIINAGAVNLHKKGLSSQ